MKLSVLAVAAVASAKTTVTVYKCCTKAPVKTDVFADCYTVTYKDKDNKPHVTTVYPPLPTSTSGKPRKKAKVHCHLDGVCKTTIIPPPDCTTTTVITCPKSTGECHTSVHTNPTPTGSGSGNGSASGNGSGNGSASNTGGSGNGTGNGTGNGGSASQTGGSGTGVVAPTDSNSTGGTGVVAPTESDSTDGTGVVAPTDSEDSASGSATDTGRGPTTATGSVSGDGISTSDTGVVAPESDSTSNTGAVAPESDSTDSGNATPTSDVSSTIAPSSTSEPTSSAAPSSSPTSEPTSSATPSSSPTSVTMPPSSSSLTPPSSSASSLLACPTANLDAEMSNLTGDTKTKAESILDFHNQKRALHGVCPLAWSDTLYQFAKQLADAKLCSDFSLTHTANNPYGENLSMGWGNDFLKGPNVWYEEGNNLDWSNPSAIPYSHFSQMIWKSTTKLGCAWKDCNAQGNGYYLVCEYDPKGNTNANGGKVANILPPV